MTEFRIKLSDDLSLFGKEGEWGQGWEGHIDIGMFGKLKVSTNPLKGETPLDAIKRDMLLKIETEIKNSESYLKILQRLEKSLQEPLDTTPPYLKAQK